MKNNLPYKSNTPFLFLIATLCFALNFIEVKAQSTDDPNQGLRAEWMRGTYGLNWKPVETANGTSENLYIDDFLDQLDGLRTLDYIQVHLGESYTTSSVHLGPHDILESLWEGDTDENGSPINLVVPRAASGRDPFLDMLQAVKNKGLKTQVYVNSSNMLLRRDIVDDEVVLLPNPDEIPNITERWKAWCDTDNEAQAYITLLQSEAIYNIDDPEFTDRKYMFCYAEFILKEYAIRYGDLIDAWIFDTGKMMYLYNGDDKESGELNDQRIYQAFANAVHEGNVDAAVSFNNSTGSKIDGENPYSSAVLFNDYMFGHPFNGGKDLGTNPNNQRMIDWSVERNGYAQIDDPLQTRTWDDTVIAHFDPPMSSTAWNAGTEPGLTDEQFVDWYGAYLLNGAALSLGVPLESTDNWNNLLMKDFALAQLVLLDNYLMENQEPKKANWARQETILTTAVVGEEYSHKLILGEDFWNSSGDEITNIFAVQGEEVPTWLSIDKDNGDYVLSGTVTDTEVTSYYFKLRIKNETGLTTRWVTLNVTEEDENATQFASVQIRATADTNYGIGEVATMLSDVMTAPDGLATYQVELKVTPPSDKAIVSGASSGDATVYAWGVGNTDSTDDMVFNGDEDDWTENISDVVIKNFEPNGSIISVSDIVFESVTIVNGQSTNDAVKFDFNNGTAKNVSNIFDKTEAVDLGIVDLVMPVTSFSLGISNQNVSDQSKNKWSVEGINVRVNFEVIDEDGDGYAIAYDCDDTNALVNPDQTEIPYDGIDNDCDPLTLDDDLDQDGFDAVDDCDDDNAEINPNQTEIPNNDIDEDCNGTDLDTIDPELEIFNFEIYPNPAQDVINIAIEGILNYEVALFNIKGNLIKSYGTVSEFRIDDIASGVYLIEITDLLTAEKKVEKIIIER